MAGEAAVYAPTFPGPPCRVVPQPYVCPRVVWPTLHCFLCWRPWRWSGPWVRRCRCWASTQQKPALQGGRGQKKGAAGLVDHLALPESCNQSPVFLRDVPGAEKGPTRVCLQRQGVGLLGFSNVPTQPHSCSPSGALPEPQHGWGCGPSSPWIQSRARSCPERRCVVTREGMAASATAKWPRPCPG